MLHVLRDINGASVFSPLETVRKYLHDMTTRYLLEDKQGPTSRRST